MSEIFPPDSHFIARYNLPFGLTGKVKMPKDARVIDVLSYGDHPYLIAVVDPTLPDVERTVHCWPIGQLPVPRRIQLNVSCKYIGVLDIGSQLSFVFVED